MAQFAFVLLYISQLLSLLIAGQVCI